MSVVVSLLRAIDRADGEALVMHVGEKPYVVTASGHAELAAKALTIPAMTGMLDQLLPPDSRHALDELGAVEYHLPQDDAASGVRYSIVAARGGDDIWIELRRRKDAPPPPAPTVAAAPPPPEKAAERHEPAAGPAGVPAPQPPIEPEADAMLERFGEPAIEFQASIDLPLAREPDPAVEPSEPSQDAPTDESDIVFLDETAAGYDALQAVQDAPPAMPETMPHVGDEAPAMDSAPVENRPADDPFELTASTEDGPIGIGGLEEEHEHATLAPAPGAEVPELDFTVPAEPEPAPATEAGEEPAPGAAAAAEETAEPEAAAHADPDAGREPEPEAETERAIEPEPAIDHGPKPAPAVAVPVARATARVDPPRQPVPRGEGLQHLLQVAAAQGASALYVATQAAPSLRVDGEIRVLDEAPLGEAQLEAGVQALAQRDGASFPLGEIETYDVPGVGRVQCLGFRDHRGLGAMFKMLPARAISAEQIGLSPAIQSLCTETEGLVLVAGARGSGKSTLVAALVDQINRTRRDHVVTVETQIQFVHENRTSFVSQREAREDDVFAEAVRAALREAPDVLVIDPVSSAEAAEFALHAAANGHLVIAALTASTTAAALGRFVEFFGEERARGRLTLAEHLRGVISQTLLRKRGGGRAAAREVLVNVPSVSSLLAEGHVDQLAAVMNGGRRVGMVPLNDALLGLVKSGALDAREAYRKSPDQQEFVEMLNREGVDTTFAERLTGS